MPQYLLCINTYQKQKAILVAKGQVKNCQKQVEIVSQITRFLTTAFVCYPSLFSCYSQGLEMCCHIKIRKLILAGDN